MVSRSSRLPTHQSSLFTRLPEKATSKPSNRRLSAGTKVDTKQKYGWTPLHYAVQGGSKEVAELLIAKCADVNAKNFQSKSPLDFAVKYKRTEIADLLRKHGGKTTVSNLKPLATKPTPSTT